MPAPPAVLHAWHRIIDAILTGTQPVNLTARWLRRNDLPLGWDEQWVLLVS